MMKYVLFVLSVCLLSLGLFPATTVQAATYDGLSGNVTENRMALPPGYQADHTVGDLPNNPHRANLNFVGESWVFGSLKKGQKDAATFDAPGYTYDLFVYVRQAPKHFKLAMNIMGSDWGMAELITKAGAKNGVFLNDLMGPTKLSLFGERAKHGKSIKYVVDVTDLREKAGVVPLPASGLLLLGGIGLLGWAKRRRQTA